MRNESDHDLLYKCACLLFFPKDIGYCTCQMIEITCKEHGIIVENDPRGSCVSCDQIHLFKARSLPLILKP